MDDYIYFLYNLEDLYVRIQHHENHNLVYVVDYENIVVMPLSNYLLYIYNIYYIYNITVYNKIIDAY